MGAITQGISSSGRLRTLLAVSRRQNDLLLAAMLVAIVALFVLPLPTALLDMLIATNLAVSVVLLIVSMYVPSALSLSTFPSLLLFTTLFRLSLNIASTKLILLQADAGTIIDTFGRLIVGNNIVVGGVVFLIIAIVQFIVIAKGSERVAEVAARFALDAMPGKQMSIDADVRAGVLSSVEAQKRRQVLERECQLHGAMDGAMKFVKGDAIAGIVIAIINILAGVTIGTLMLDMGIGSALQRYAVLTVGDGMVSQIPSLLVSIAAGVVITRVGSGDPEDAQLSGQIGRQLLARPRALIVAALTLSVFLVVPGFPKWAFGLLVVGILAAGLFMRVLQKSRNSPAWIRHDGSLQGDEAAPVSAIASPLAVSLSIDLRGKLDRGDLDQRLIAAKGGVEADMGPIFPKVQFGYSAHLPSNRYQILVQDVPLGTGVLSPGSWMLDPAETSTPPDAVVVEPFGPFHRAVWVSSPPPGSRVLSCEEVLVSHLEHTVRLHAHRLLGLQEVQQLIHSVQRDAPDLAAELVRTVPVQLVGEVLRRLLDEGIAIRNLRSIFETLIKQAPKETDSISLTESVRMDLGSYISSKYASRDRSIEAILLEQPLALRVATAIDRSSPHGTFVQLSPAVMQDLREQVRALLGSAPMRTVIVVSSELRRAIQTVVKPVAPQLPVLSYQELDEDVAMKPVGWLTNPKVE